MRLALKSFVAARFRQEIRAGFGAAIRTRIIEVAKFFRIRHIAFAPGEFFPGLGCIVIRFRRSGHGVADSGAVRGGQPTPDLLVVGAGVAGLWLALKAARAGLSVTLVERDRIGAGASGGFLGALMPHSPDRWNGKKDFQFRALVDLEGEVARLESETGLDCGYKRVGRLLPLGTEQARNAALANIAEARTNWGAV
jgi:hypothetical protein